MSEKIPTIGAESRTETPKFRLRTFAAREDARNTQKSEQFCEDYVLNDPELGVFGVLDGVGGHTGGKEAAREVAVAFQDAARAWQGLTSEEVEPLLAGVTRAMQERLLVLGEKLSQEPRFRGSGSDVERMSTTACLMHLGKDKEGKSRAIILNIGDSRAYLVPGGGKRIKPLTHDRHVFLGAGAKQAPEPEIEAVSLEAGDGIVFLTDGVLSNLTDIDIEYAIKWALLNDRDPAQVLTSYSEWSRHIWPRTRARELPPATANGVPIVDKFQCEMDDRSAVFVRLI